MEGNDPAGEEIDIDEVMRITGKSRATIMRWKAQKKLTTRTAVREFKQRQTRVLFLKEEILALAGKT